MASIGDKVVINAMIFSWFMSLVSSGIMISGVVFCYLGIQNPGSSMSIGGFQLQSSGTGLFVTALGLILFHSQKKLIQDLTDLEKLSKLSNSLGQNIAEVKIALQAGEGRGE